MGFLDSLFGKKVPNENKTTPFFKCSTTESRRDWFSRTQPWHNVSPGVVDAIEAKLKDKGVLYELFVQTSTAAGLVPRYEKIDASVARGDVACAVMGGMLMQMGAPVAQQVVMRMQSVPRNPPSEREMEGIIKQAAMSKDCLESAVAICPEMVPAYGALAVLMASTGDLQEGLKYAQQGLEEVRKQRASGTPFHESSIESVRNAPQDMAAMEHQLQGLVDALAADMRPR